MRNRPARKRNCIKPFLERLEERSLPTVVPGSFAGLDFNASGGSEPPDAIIGVGPADIVEAVNTEFAFYQKTTGALIFEESFTDFFAQVGGGPSADMFDPRVTYDDQAGRFVMSIMEQNDTSKTSFLDFAVSNTSDPMQGFSEVHRISMLENLGGKLTWADFPKLGRNADAYVWTFNMYSFPNATGTFDHVQGLIVAKSSLLDFTSSTLITHRFDRTNPFDFTLAGAEIHDGAPGGPMWFVEEDNGSSDIRLVEMTNVLSSTPTFTDFTVNVPAYGDIVNPIQPNGKTITTIIDSDILNAAMRGTELVADQNVGSGGVTRARWYEFSTAGAAPALVQSGEINRGAGVFTFFPGIDITPSGSLGMSFLESSSHEFMSMYAVAKSPLDPAGTFEPAVLVQAGQTNYNGERAGDFSGAASDPVDGTLWVANEYTNQEPTNWGTWIAHMVPKPIITVTGADAGGGPDVRVFDTTGALAAEFFAYDPHFRGGVRVAVGSLANGDPEVVTAPGPGGGPDIRVFDGVTGQLLREFYAYSPLFTGGVYVALGDVNGDGIDDIVTGADAGGGPQVIAYSGRDLSVLRSFYAYSPFFNGGVRVAVGDVNGDGKADIITGAGAGGGPHVEAFSGVDGSLLRSFMAYPVSFSGGVYVAAGDINGDGKADIITGQGAGGQPEVKVYSGVDSSIIWDFMAYPTAFLEGVRVASEPDFNADGKAEIITALGPGAQSNIVVFEGASVAALDSYFAYNQLFLGGVFVGGG
jgi:hypothetical protein